MIYVAPSVLSADFGKLAAECREVLDAGADYLHIDVMDGHFVPNITIGVPVLKSLARGLQAFYDVHLMISEPQKYIDSFADAGASLITFHIEAEGDPAETIRMIKSRGLKAGIALRPATPIEKLLPYLADIDLALVMTVEPGFGGQQFMSEQCQKVWALREKRDELGLGGLLIEVDGGIDKYTAQLVVQAGAQVLVAGTSVFGRPDRKKAVEALKSAAEFEPHLA